MSKLLAGRFEQDDSSAALLEQFDSIESLGIDWAVDDFGVTRIEAIVKANGSYDAYQRYDDVKKGHRFAVYGDDLHKPVSGWIFETEWLPGDRIRYIAYGVNFRMEDAYIVRKFDPTDDIQTAVTYIASKIKVASTNTDNIAANATTLDGWNTSYPQGDYPSEAIPQLLDMSDSNNAIYDFRMIDEPLAATSLQQFTPYYTKRDSTSSADWIIKRADLATSGLKISRNIAEYANIVRVWYGIIEGTSTAVTANTMTDAAATFYDDGVQPGDQITNVTKGGHTRVISVDSQTVLTHEGWRPKLRGIATGGSATTLVDTEADFVNDGVIITTNTVKNIADDSTGIITGVTATQLTIGAAMSGGKTNEAGERYEVFADMIATEDYSIATSAQVKYEEYQIDKGDLWNRERSVFERSMNSTQAAQYAKVLATIDPQQVQSFIISAPFISDGNGAKRPLFDVIAYGGGYIQLSDLYPAAAQFSDALNALTTFWITSMSLDDKTNKLTVDVDNPSRRLDARLRREKILRVPQVRRY